jgi:HD superfamily phosphodiesterase
MKIIHKKIWRIAKPYLDTRQNHIHTAVAFQLAYRLLAQEGGEEDIVVPAVLLHDVGWSQVPEKLQLEAFGPKATNPKLSRRHEIEGVKIAGKVLESVNYDQKQTARILEIIGGHDSRQSAISLNDMIVKDADKLWRYTNSGFYIDIERFGESPDEGLNRLRKNLSTWFFTGAAKEKASAEIKKREREIIDPVLP